MQGFNKLYSHLVSKTETQPPLKAAVIQPIDQSSLQSTIESAKNNIISPILIGSKEKITTTANSINIDISEYEIVDIADDKKAVEFAINAVNRNEAQAIIKGNIHTDILMGAIVNKTSNLRTGRRMSHVFLVVSPRYHKPLMITDAALNIQPDLATKVDIVQNAIDLFKQVFDTQPKVAALSAVEYVTDKLPATLDAAALCKMAERGQISGAIIDGPLAFDNAISQRAAKIKKINSPICGDPDILLVPNLEAGNILYKQMRYLSDAEGAGIVLGCKVPIILTSRSEDSVISRNASCALAKICACANNISLMPPS